MKQYDAAAVAAMVRDQVVTQAFAYGERAYRTRLHDAGGVAVVEQYARNLRAAAMTYYKTLAGETDVELGAAFMAATSGTIGVTPSAADSVAALLDVAFTMGAGAVNSTIMADAAGVRERAFIAWATARDMPVETTGGIDGVTLRTLYVRFPGNPHPIASLMVPINARAL